MMVPVISDEEIQRLAELLGRIDGAVGVVLGGSRARGTNAPDSDHDLGLYYRGAIDLNALRDLVRNVAGASADVTAPGDWGPWVDGGAWLTVGGSAVDLIYRDLSRVRECWKRAQRGEFDFHFQVGHPLGVTDFSYPGELALSSILCDPSGVLVDLQLETRKYPAALASALVDRLWEADFSLRGAAKGVSRNDSAYVAGCLFRVVLLCAHALHGYDRVWLINEKDAVRAAARLPSAPSGFDARVGELMSGLGLTSDELNDQVAAAEQLLVDVRRACGR